MGETGQVPAGDETTLAFVCVQNAGRSQMSAAFAERERNDSNLQDVEIISGGTDPADEIHPEVVETMAELDIDIADRRPREVSTAELEACDVVATMGCSTLDLDADTDIREWDLPDPDGKPPEQVREIRGQVRERVAELLDELLEETERPG
jgi:protein-tyrosine-phosphatase